MKRILSLFAALALLSLTPLVQTGCQSQTTLAPGGVYSDLVLAQTDQSILTADGILTGFVQWQAANAPTLGADIAALAAKVSAGRKQWIVDAYAARDAYAADSKAYKAAIAAGMAGAVPPSTAKISAALSVIANITTQVTAYKSAHPNV